MKSSKCLEWIFPNTDHFHTARDIIKIPREIISEIIHKGNHMQLVGANFSKSNYIPRAFYMTLLFLQIDIDIVKTSFRGLPEGVVISSDYLGTCKVRVYG